jgi:hypothetical protein
LKEGGAIFAVSFVRGDPVESPILKWFEDRAGSLADTPEELRPFHEDLRQVAGVAPISHKAAGVLVRNIIERLVRALHNTELGDPKSKPLFDMIEGLREKGKLPPRIASYLHTIRRIGDDAAHHEVSREDLLAALIPLLLVIEWYFCSFEKGPRAESIYSSDRRVEAPPAGEAPQSAIEHADLIERLIRLAEQGPRAFSLRLWVEKEGASRSVRDFAPDPQMQPERFRLGERATVCACADRDCYLWIVDVGTTGLNAIIFPRSAADSNRVRANQVVRITGTLTGKPGLETLHAFASVEPLSEGRAAGRAVRDFLVDEEANFGGADCAVESLQFAIE